MEDMYQYAAAATTADTAGSNNNNEENDVILKAFHNMGWGKKWSSLVDTVKKQSEAFVEGTKRDLQEFAQVLTEDGEEEEQEDNSLELIRESLASINTVNFTSLKDGLMKALEQRLPSQVQSVHLPENMDLKQLKEGLARGTRSAEHYLQTFGTEVISALKNTVTVIGPEEEQQEQQQQQANRRIYATRKETLIAKMQANPDTYLKDPESEEETKVLKTFNDTFKIDEYTEEIAQLLNDNPELRDMMNTLVPMQVSYPLFWQRYFYQAWKIDQDEQKRQLIVQSVKEEDENDFKWDSDDEEMTIKDNVKRSSEDTDFSQISNPSSTPQLQSTEDEWVKTETQKKETIKSKNDNNNNNNDDDDDSDWE